MSAWAGKTPTADEWRDILGKHSRWLRSAEGGSRANLNGADLNEANLNGADLSRANLSRAKYADLAIARTRILPEGSLIGWKKCRGNAIVCLIIPVEAKRSHAFGRKCRAEFAEVSGIEDRNGKEIDQAVSFHSDRFIYRKGETVRPTEPFDENWQNECGSGIHFYLTREEAQAHK